MFRQGLHGHEPSVGAAAMSYCALPAQGTTAATCMPDSDVMTMLYLRNELVPSFCPGSNLVSGQVLHSNTRR